jgi:UDP-GlcNAc:undecaprenyl-phosphate GlcNAc-1-phosphate transferase
MSYLVLAFFGGLVLALIATALVRELAVRYGFVDRPDGGRKAHAKPVALGGGAALFAAASLASFAAVAYTALWSGLARDAAYLNLEFLGTLFVASCMIVAVGLVDDVVGLRGTLKLAGQVTVALFLIYAGNIRIDRVALLGSVFELGPLAIPFTVAWLVAAINAINLIDGIDGLAGSVGLVLCVTMSAIMVLQDKSIEAIVMAALAGSLLGFLRYNFAPASIYMGDTGSMLIGLVIGVAAIRSSFKGPATLGLAVPAAVWAIPLLDSGAAILRRKLTGRSLFAPDRGHFHHSLLVRGWTVRQAVLFIGLVCAATCVSALLSYQLNNEWISLIAVAAVVTFLVSTRIFGHMELALIRNHFRHGTRALSRHRAGSSAPHFESKIHLQGTREWDKLWAAIVESAPDYGLLQVKLSVNVPAIHEVYFATWKASPETPKAAIDNAWKVRLPLRVDGRVAGELELWGDVQDKATIGRMMELLDFLEPIEEDVRHILEHIQIDGAAVRTRRLKARPGEDSDASLPTPAASATAASLALPPR